MLKKAVSILLTMLLLSALLLPVSAKEVPDLDATGSITVHLKSGEQNLNSGTLTFYRVGKLVNTNENYSYQLTSAFVDSGVSLDDIHSPRTAEALAAYVEKQKPKGTTIAVENGVAVLQVPKGELGLYLVMQHQPADGWQPISPFLVSVPNMVDGKYQYHVDATPKIGELVPNPPITPNPPDPPEPSYPPEPSTPPEESKPSKPLKPVKPSKPQKPSKPSNPSKPTDPSKPTQPSKPEVPTLPQTGQLNWPIPVLAVLGMVLVAAGLWLRSRGRRHDREA